MKIRPYQPGDEFAAVNLFQLAFNKRIAPDQWLWKFRGRPLAIENIWFAEADGLLVGQYGALPGMLRLEDQEKPFVVAVDAMVHPEYRKRGILTKLVQHTHSRWRDAGVALVLGLPNRQWGSRKEALGWESLFRLRYLTFPLKPALGEAGQPGFLPAALAHLGKLRLEFLRRRMVSKSDLSIEQLSEPSQDLERLWEVASRQNYTGVVRDRNYLTWRYFHTPSQDYSFLLAYARGSPAGYLAYRLPRSATGQPIHIADLLTKPKGGAIRSRLCLEVLDVASKSGSRGVITTAIPGSRLYSAWRKIGFLPGRRFFNVMTAPLDPAIPVSSLCQRTHWHMTSGDFDIV